MSNANDIMEQYKELQDITHIVTQIEKVRVKVDAKLRDKRYPDQDILDVLADAMEDVAGITRIHPQNGEGINIYTELRNGRIPLGLCEQILRWQKETLNWVDHMESRRQIQALQEEVQNQAELIQQLLDQRNS